MLSAIALTLSLQVLRTRVTARAALGWWLGSVGLQQVVLKHTEVAHSSTQSQTEAERRQVGDRQTQNMVAVGKTLKAHVHTATSHPFLTVTTANPELLMWLESRSCMPAH